MVEVTQVIYWPLQKAAESFELKSCGSYADNVDGKFSHQKLPLVDEESNCRIQHWYFDQKL